MIPSAAPSTASRIKQWWSLPGRFGYRLYSAVMNAVDLLIASPLQRVLGPHDRMGYFFVLPNTIVFGLFVLFPMLLNFYFTFTGGTKLFPQDRPFVGLQNYQQIFDCQNYLVPNTCTEDLFW